ncbi:hypothetical protein Pla100_49800 [Neorhodopirellula pilleata]|uniref:Uncharacterized protein n=1 Tax=Neorhodopirellula pilleata TaxID=2714738 RepID=A0A5C5ZXQ9_9BACT|nr:hypothetical protein Pla100_49800 [Neorhodopirellula pilleata]
MLLSGSIGLGAFATASIGHADDNWQDNRHFRAAPAVHSGRPSSDFHTASTADRPHPVTSTQRSGWNLQWRTSPTIAAEQARRISDSAFEDKSTRPDVWTTQPNIVAASGQPVPVELSQQPTQQPAHQPATDNRLRQSSASNVQRVAWLNQNAANPNADQPAGGFSIPDNLFRDSAANPPSSPTPNASTPPNSSTIGTPEILPPGEPSFGLPEAIAPMQVLPVPKSAPGIPDELSELFEIDPPAADSKPINPMPQPESTAPADGSSIRDMIQGEPAPVPVPRDQAPSNTPDVVDEIDSPSDRETFAPNPFQNREDERAAERRQSDAQREEQRERNRVRDAGRPSIFSDDDGPASSGTGLSCDDFRDRIEASTIDQVSLDISPPFRPDVIDEDEFQKLRGKFQAKQEARVWRSIDGRPLGTGRLEDLAYEKAVITTEFGSQEELPLNRLSEPDLAYISQNWGLPTECLIEQVAYTPRSWTPTTMTYVASNLCHKPLYFEEVNLERYGHTAGPFAQPVISSAHFFFNIAVLPYKMGVHSPHECQYALGYYRPGNCAPWIIPPVPLSVKGAWYQAAAITGTALLVP